MDSTEDNTIRPIGVFHPTGEVNELYIFYIFLCGGSKGVKKRIFFFFCSSAHIRTGSAGSALELEKNCYENFKCRKLSSVKAHQQPITVLDCESGRIVTGSQDHTLKVNENKFYPYYYYYVHY